MDKLDFKKIMKPYWTPPVGAFAIIEVPTLSFIKIDGKGDPNTTEEYSRAVQWLYTMSYTLKFASKADGRDYGVAPLEGLWWAEDMSSFGSGDKSKWLWTAMMMQPDWIDTAAFAKALDRAKSKLGEPPQSLRLQPFEEGLSVQTMHIGPYSAEAPTIAKLHTDFLPAHGLIENGHHHEIYLSDPGRTASDKLRTIIRQPVRRT